MSNWDIYYINNFTYISEGKSSCNLTCDLHLKFKSANDRLQSKSALTSPLWMNEQIKIHYIMETKWKSNHERCR